MPASRLSATPPPRVCDGVPDIDAQAEVAAAADQLVGAFARHDRDAYFDCFAPEATFLFHSSPAPFGSRVAYEQEWAQWEADGFRVLGCESSQRQITMVGNDVAILTHSVVTTLDGAEAPMRERETIVFHRQADGRWLAVHEHLSADSASS